uniref:Aurora kinase n=1 Tax=Ditylenchus dipsaci TaxID=166011 RepID=A0A915CUX8_9BILA
MTVVVSGCNKQQPGDPPQPPAPRSTSRSNKTANNSSGMRFSSSKLRATGSGSTHAGAGSSALGGPMNSAEPGSSKMDIKHRFEITAKLGSGTYGKVSLAYDHKMEREVAVKLIKKSAIENKQDLVRIRREIRIMSMLKHPNVIQIYEVFENKDKIILVMEYASGGELYDYVSKFGSLPESEARRIFRQITSAVLYCHKHKVAHRDLKLENILLDASNNAKIADFGLSNYFNEKNLLNTFCGSPLYASPEIINGTPYKGPEVDCWSLGILLYTLVYGSMPFDGRDFNRMVRQIKRGAYYEPDTPSTASMLVRNMLRVNPDRRADIDDIASHWWLNLEENMPVIQELPENQIIDHTPLTERAEIMVVQDLADETDVFMEFGHLSHSTRQKIEEFRRRRKEAEEYNENSPIKPPKTRRTSNAKDNVPEMTAKEKSLRHQEEPKAVAATSIIPSEGKNGLPTTPVRKEKNAFQDPLERLRQLESRLQGGRQQAAAAVEPTEPSSPKRKSSAANEKPAERKSSQGTKEAGSKTKLSNSKKSMSKEEKFKSKPVSAVSSPTKASAPALPTADAQQETSNSANDRRPAFVSPTETAESRNSHSGGSQKSGVLAAVAAAVTAGPASSSRHTSNPQQYWRLETDSLNVLMNQVLEQMDKGQVSMNLVARVKAHPFYDERPMVKELLESIISAQPASVQKEASKIIQQQQKSQDTLRRQTSSKVVEKSESSKASAKSKTSIVAKIEPEPPKTPTAKININKYQVVELPPDLESKKALLRKTILDERPWHSVEADSSPTKSNAPTTIPVSAPKFIGTRATRSEPLEEDEEYEEEEEEEEDEFYDAEEDEEEYESDIDELAQVVENVTNKSSRRSQQPVIAPTIVENLAEPQPLSPNQPKEISTNHLSTLERGLAKRQSKGKYQFLHHQVEMYGRGVSMEAESPPPAKKRIGGPQPRPEHSPILFDKAKNYLMNYPDKINDSDTEEDAAAKKKKMKAAAAKAKEDSKKWLKSQDPDVPNLDDKSSTVTPLQDITTAQCPQKSSYNHEVGWRGGRARRRGRRRGGRRRVRRGRREYQPPIPAATFHHYWFPYNPTIGADGIRKEAPIVQVKPQASTAQGSSSSTISKKLGSEKSSSSKGTTANTPKMVNQPATPTTPNISKADAFSKNATATHQPTSTTTTFPPNNAKESEQIVVDEPGMQKWETAGAYIRRKNRERRARNKTIAVGEEVHQAWIRLAENHQEIASHHQQVPPSPTTKVSPIEAAIMRRKSSLGGGAIVVGSRAGSIVAADTTTLKAEVNNTNISTSNHASPATGYHRPSYLDERKLQQQQYEPNYSRQTYVDRRKSFQEMTPNIDSLEERCLSPFSAAAYHDRGGYVGYGGGGLASEVVGAFGPPPTSNVSRYEDEVYNAFYPTSANQGWTNEPHRFEVYRTRAERAADYNSSNYGYRAGGGGHSYYHSSDNHRPTSAYIPSSSSTYKSSYEVDTGGGGPAYRRSSAYIYSPADDAGRTTPSTEVVYTPTTAPDSPKEGDCSPDFDQ